MRFTSFAVALGLAAGRVIAEGSGDDQGGALGDSRLNPVFVDPIDDDTVSLIPEGTYLDSHQVEVFERLVGGIVEAQEGIAEISQDYAVFELSIELWVYLYEHINKFEVLKADDYISALQALREAIWSVEPEQEVILELRKLGGRILVDNLVLIGFFNDVYGVEEIPPYLIDWPGELIGALIQFLAIDVTQGL